MNTILEMANPIEEPESGIFSTGIDYLGKPKNVTIQKDIITCPSFFEVSLPIYDNTKLSLKLPEKINLPSIEHNAYISILSNGSKIKLEKFMAENESLLIYTEALISDSFWLIVYLFQIKNEEKQKMIKMREESEIKFKSSSQKKVKISSDSNQLPPISPANSNKIIHSKDKSEEIIQTILKRMSKNYFNFFIRVCDLGQTVAYDSYLNEFKDFMTYNVYYSIYLTFPKSRHLFNEQFQNRLMEIFSYLFNGVTIENHFNKMNWELDLGKGNIIEEFPVCKEEEQLILPEVSEIKEFIEKNFQLSKYKKAITKSKANIVYTNNKKTRRYFQRKEVKSDILNTPLYRLYAENNKFSTLNLLKPIKITNRKIIDIQDISKKHKKFIEEGKRIYKDFENKKSKFEEFKKAKLEEYAKRAKVLTNNENRIKEEMAEIRIMRAQEYANYLLFISK